MIASPSWPDSSARSTALIRTSAGSFETARREGDHASKDHRQRDIRRRQVDLPYIELDALHHGPNWSQPTPEEFRDRVRRAMDAFPGGWIIDGNYESKLGDLATAEADTVVWLDLPLPITFVRLSRRTFHRIRHDVELWNGNRETWRNTFMSRDSILVWMFRAHCRHRREWPARYAQDPRLVRLRTRAEVRRWLGEQTGRYHHTTTSCRP